MQLNTFCLQILHKKWVQINFIAMHVWMLLGSSQKIAARKPVYWALRCLPMTTQLNQVISRQLPGKTVASTRHSGRGANRCKKNSIRPLYQNQFTRSSGNVQAYSTELDNGVSLPSRMWWSWSTSNWLTLSKIEIRHWIFQSAALNTGFRSLPHTLEMTAHPVTQVDSSSTTSD